MTRPQVLPDDLATARAAGVTTVISLLEPGEAAKFGLAAEASLCASLGMTFLSHPVRDMHLPEPPAFQAFAAETATLIRNGADVALHCYASIGRSGMLACTLLGHFGYTADAAIAHVSTCRGTPVPDTAEQAAFIHRIMAPPAASFFQ